VSVCVRERDKERESGSQCVIGVYWVGRVWNRCVLVLRMSLGRERERERERKRETERMCACVTERDKETE